MTPTTPKNNYVKNVSSPAAFTTEGIYPCKVQPNPPFAEFDKEHLPYLYSLDAEQQLHI